jgi:arsenical pump membrane protein
LAAIVSVTAVVAVLFRHQLEHPDLRNPPTASAAGGSPPAPRARLGAGLAGVAAAVAAVLVLSPGPMALVVAGLGSGALCLRTCQGRVRWRGALHALNLPVLAGLLGLAVGLGTLGGAWSGPADLLRRMTSWETAAFAAAVSVVINNLPAASLLAMGGPRDPYALLIGLNLGPNLVVTGALSGVLWLQVGRMAGGHPSAGRVSLLGLAVVPISVAAALGAWVLAR